mgnify:CR=1 FL=1
MKKGVCLFLGILFLVSFVAASSMEISIDVDFDENESDDGGDLELYVPGQYDDEYVEGDLSGGVSLDDDAASVDGGNGFRSAIANSDTLLFVLVLVGVLIILGLGFGVYFLVRGKGR